MTWYILLACIITSLSVSLAFTVYRLNHVLIENNELQAVISKAEYEAAEEERGKIINLKYKLQQAEADVERLKAENQKAAVKHAYEQGLYDARKTDELYRRFLSKLSLADQAKLLIDSNHRWELISFKTSEEAEKAIRSLKQIYEQYGCITVADYYEVGYKCAPFTETKYGWKTADGIDCECFANCYVVTMGCEPQLLEEVKIDG